MPIAELVCPRCKAQVSAAMRFRGCPRCIKDGCLVNAMVALCEPETVRRAMREACDLRRQGMWQFASLLRGVAGAPVSLGEGGTPLTPLKAMGEWTDVASLYVKNETVNPTWSHKDRFASVAISSLAGTGRRVVAVASTGNQAMAVAAYAARAGVRVVVVSAGRVPAPVSSALEAYGAEVMLVDHIDERYERLRQGVEREGWIVLSNFVSPPIGSDPIGAQGYKTVAYEIWAQLGNRTPEWVVVPTGYGDCLSGIWNGMKELIAAGLATGSPRVVAAERFGPVREYMHGNSSLGPVASTATRAISIGTSYGTWQSVCAVQESGGVAETCGEEELLEAQREVAGREGLFVEPAAAVGLAVVRRLRQVGVIGGGDTVVWIATGSGCKLLGGAVV